MLCNGVKGQETARRYFTRAIENQRLSHAYLFVGPPGVGKARFALELASALLCREPAAGGACGACIACRTIASGNHPGFTRHAPLPGKTIEIDRVRALNEELSVRTAETRVLILDDVDRLTLPAANALLKLLEEPPPGTLFVLVTSHPAQVIETIHSRCHRVPFAPLDRDEFADALRSLDADPDAAGISVERLFEATGGAPGSALRLLEGIEACGPERFRELLEGAGADRPESLVDYLPPLSSKETKRDRVRRLLELLLEGVWGQRADSDDVALRERAGARALEIAGILEALGGNQNPDLVLEQTARVLRSR